LLTREHGRVSALARAARKSKKRFAGSLEGFALIAVDLSFGRGQLARLDAARVTRVFPRVLSDLPAMEAAGGLMRLARDLMPERVPDEAVFEALSESLVLLDSAEPLRSTKAVAVAGAAQLLALLGFAPMLSECVACGKQPGATQSTLFDPPRGGIVCRACGGGPERMSSKVRALLSFALESPLRDAVEHAAQGELREAERLLSLFTAHVLARDPKGR
jgi:DNA repair protein RecO (recombination protein O)